MKTLTFLKDLEAVEKRVVGDIVRGAVILTVFFIAAYQLKVMEAVSDWTGLPALREFDATILVVLYATWLIGIFALRRAAEIRQILVARSRLQKQLESVQHIKSVGLMARGVALDINNFLTVAIGCSDIVLEESTDSAVQQGVREIRRSAEKTGKLTHRLLAFARERQFEAKPLDLNEVIAEMKTVILQLLGDLVEYEMAYQTNMPYTLSDRVYMEQAILNLVVNAREAMPSGGKLRLETSRMHLYAPEAAELGLREGSHIVMTVSDTGEGIPRESLPQIFDPYFSTRAAGAGLGLCAVQDTVKRSHGAIRIESQPGRGTTVRLYFRAA